MDSEPKHEPANTGSLNPGFAAAQIAKALTRIVKGANAETEARARERMAKWARILDSILSGSIAHGSRTPLAGTPAWATLEVAHGGFATGDLLAGGPLKEHERTLQAELCINPDESSRSRLNSYFLSEEGLGRLQEWLQTGKYDISVPEEGCLLVVAWLASQGLADDALHLVEQVSTQFPALRFYPAPSERAQRASARIHVQDVGTTLTSLKAIKPNRRILAQQESVQVWNPLHDKIVALFLETVSDDWPCRHYPDDWQSRASALIEEYARLRATHALCGKFERPNGHYYQLRHLLTRCAENPQALTGRDVGKIRLILQRYLDARGAPDSSLCLAKRQRQMADVSSPSFHDIAHVMIGRLNPFPKDDGLDSLVALTEAVSNDEALHARIPAGTPIPDPILRKVARCLNDTMPSLIDQGLITSGETLARILPQVTAGIRASGIDDPVLRQLYAAIYRAFRRRRSLLLLNLEKQVQIEELPWIAAIDRFRQESLPDRNLARQTLEEVVATAISAFPQAILPNKLLQELRALAHSADLSIPLVDELAADIFMGQFSDKFVEAARQAGALLTDSLYARYYGIDYVRILEMLSEDTGSGKRWFRQKPQPRTNTFAGLCAARAGVQLGTWHPAANGMVIEQQQILTTQNLATLFASLGLRDQLQEQLPQLARQCFRWICWRLQMKVDNWHSQLITVKNTAYAWRQMTFFLSLARPETVSDFLLWAHSELDRYPGQAPSRLIPAVLGLEIAAAGASLDGHTATEMGAQRFLGWSVNGHWLLETRVR